MKLLDGKELSKNLKEEIKKEIEGLVSEGKRPPSSVAIIVGNDGGSRTYVDSKIKNFRNLGFNSNLIELSEDISQEDLIKEIVKLNNDKSVDGYILQMPLPKHIDEEKVTEMISPEKDIDGLNPMNLGRLTMGSDKAMIPATPYGVVEMLKSYNIDTQGKYAVVIGRSNIVGKPMNMLMSRNNKEVGNSTVTMVHSRTQDLEGYTKKADIIIVAIGKANFLKKEMIKEGAVIVDVGINRIEDSSKKSGFRLLGDVDFEDVKEKSSYITPVPGGVGSMTIVMLMKNVLKAYYRNI